MKIRIHPRSFFDHIRGSAEEIRLLESYKIISINSSQGDDSVPPFSECNRTHPNLLCLSFDDIDCESEEYLSFSRQQAEAIMRFVNDGRMPLLIHCTAGISRSGAVGEILDWYFNRYIADNREDHSDFVQNNKQIIPNSLVRRVFLDYLNSKTETRQNESAR